MMAKETHTSLEGHEHAERRRSGDTVRALRHAVAATFKVTAEQAERWREGAERFRVFCAACPPETWPKRPHTMYLDPGDLQAMFLGEKPAVFGSPFEGTMVEALDAAGFEAEGRWAYDRRKLQDIIDTHAAEFAEYPADIRELLKLISNSLRSHHAVRGLLLGIPEACIRQHAEQDQTQRASRIVDVCGVRWYEHERTPESDALQARLRAAFETTGIVDIFPDPLFENRCGMT